MIRMGGKIKTPLRFCDTKRNKKMTDEETFSGGATFVRTTIGSDRDENGAITIIYRPDRTRTRLVVVFRDGGNHRP
jgi:hypothetical protein